VSERIDTSALRKAVEAAELTPDQARELLVLLATNPARDFTPVERRFLLEAALRLEGLPAALDLIDELRAENERLKAGLTVIALDAESKNFDALAGTLLLFRDGQIERLTSPVFHPAQGRSRE